jgi:hypothetical protein
MNDLGFEPQQEKELFPFTKMLTLPPVKWVPGFIPGSKVGGGREV